MNQIIKDQVKHLPQFNRDYFKQKAFNKGLAG
jgi:hypothetical protein